MTEIERIAASLTEKWCANPNEIHMRPPFKPHSFDDDGRYWVVGSTRVSVLHWVQGPLDFATRWADALNNSPAAIAYLEGQKHD